MLLEKPTLPHYIDSTMIATFRACHMKFNNNFIKNLVLDGESIHLTAGGAIAVALQTIRNAQFNREEMHIDDLMHLAIGPFLKHWGSLRVEADQAKNIHNCLWCLEEYLRFYHPKHDDVQPLERQDGSATTEFSFAIPLPISHPSGDPFVYCGRFDLLGMRRSLGDLVILDDKTTGSLGAAWARQWDLRGQFIGYTWACQQLGYAVTDVVVRGIGIYKTGPKLLSVPLTYPKHLVDRWYLQLLQTINILKLCYENDQWSYDFADACSSYGGCPYTDLCKHKEPEAWYSNYVTRTWSPVQHNETIG